jgi:ABC-type microcin C transport system permease subunit YejB
MADGLVNVGILSAVELLPTSIPFGISDANDESDNNDVIDNAVIAIVLIILSSIFF